MVECVGCDGVVEVSWEVGQEKSLWYCQKLAER
jgi:hypothetical protein